VIATYNCFHPKAQCRHTLIYFFANRFRVISTLVDQITHIDYYNTVHLA